MNFAYSFYVNALNGNWSDQLLSRTVTVPGNNHTRQDLVTTEPVTTLALPSDKVTSFVIMSNDAIEVCLNRSIERITVKDALAIIGTEVTAVEIYAPIGTTLTVFTVGG